jgi:uncharacterized protein YuzE
MVQNVLVNLSGKELKMDKNIIVELDESGLVIAVYCPDETYTVDVLDHSDWVRLDAEEGDMAEYYEDLEKERKNLKNCY